MRNLGNTVAQGIATELRFDGCRQGKCLIDTDSSRSLGLNESAPDRAGPWIVMGCGSCNPVDYKDVPRDVL